MSLARADVRTTKHDGYKLALPLGPGVVSVTTRTEPLPVAISRWAYRNLPETEGANRFDRTWRAFGWRLRVYVGQMTRRHASWAAWLDRGEFSVNVRLTGERIGRGTYSGPQPSTRASCDAPENWTFSRRWRWRGRDKYGWCRFDLGHYWFTVRSPRMWSVGYHSRHVEAYGRLRRKAASS